MRHKIIMRGKIIIPQVSFTPWLNHLDLKIRSSQLRLVTTFIIFKFMFL